MMAPMRLVETITGMVPLKAALPLAAPPTVTMTV